MPPVIAIDAMGGDRAPAEIVAGALQAVDACDVDVLLVGPPDVLRVHLPDERTPPRVALLDASEVIAMDEEPASAVRAKKDSSIVRAAEAVRDGRAAAMVGAGNTGATMAAALLRFGRIRGVHRPAIAIPIPVIGEDRIQLLVDGGATVDPDPEWLVEWAELARAYARVRLGVREPTIALLSNGEEPSKGTPELISVHEQLAGSAGAGLNFIGNIEGTQLPDGVADVLVMDGFIGNAALFQVIAGDLARGVVGERGLPMLRDLLVNLEQLLLQVPRLLLAAALLHFQRDSSALRQTPDRFNER